MKHLYSTLCAAALMACAFTAPAHAESQVGDFTFSANVGVYSDYVYRGVSQTDENPALQGGFDVAHTSGLYAGIWGSNVDFNDGNEASVEIDYFVGYANTYEGFNYDLGFLYYTYPGANDNLDYDFYEVSGALGYDFDFATLSGSVNYSPEYFGDTGDAVYFATAVDVPLPYDFSFNAHAGYQAIDKGYDYTDWSLGLGYSIAGFDLSLAYYDTDLDEPQECADGCDARVVAGVSRRF